MFLKTIARQGKEICRLHNKVEEQRKENIALYEENRVLRFEVEELEDFKKKATSIMKSKDTIVNKYDKLKELVDDYQSIN